MKKLLALIIPAYLFAGSATLTFENDAFADDDAGYTNGVRLSYVSEHPGFMLEESYQTHSFFQHMYTPSEINIAEPQPDDRPWAGTAGYQYNETSEDLGFGFQIGFAGPKSKADKTQIAIHKWFDHTEPLGWDNQLPDKFLLNAMFNYRNEYIDTHVFDINNNVAVVVGTTLVEGVIVEEIRIGKRPDNYQWAVIEPIPLGFQSNNEWYAYISCTVAGRAVLYNWTLTGVDTLPFVGEARIGVSFGIGSIALSYFQAWRSPEFDGDSNENFGSLNLSYRF